MTVRSRGHIRPRLRRDGASGSGDGYVLGSAMMRNAGSDDMPSLDSNDCRTLIISQQRRADDFGRQPGYVAFIEAENILRTTTGADTVDVIGTPFDGRARARRFAGRQLRRLSHSAQAVPAVVPGRPGPELTADRYDLGVFIGFTVWDLPLLERLPEVRQRCDRLVGIFFEAWPYDLERPIARYEPFDLFDSVFVGMEKGAKVLAGLTNAAVHHLPMAVDTATFAPSSGCQRRPIDVLGIGRRDPDLHEALLDWSHKSASHYVYDTMSGSTVPDIGAHRINLGDTYRRSGVALTNYAKADLPEVTNGEREVPGRLWEALAGGALMVGRPPDADLQERVIGRVVVHEAQPSAAETVELIADLLATDRRRERVEQSILALRRHDWAHRWRDVYRASELPVPQGVETRIEQLAANAAALDH